MLKWAGPVLVLSAALSQPARLAGQGRFGGQGRPAEPPAAPTLPHPSPASTPAPQEKPKPRLFRAQDLGLLEAPDRAEWQKPDRIMDALKIADGARVADLGASGGWFTIRLAHRVGPNGFVYAEDSQPAMIEAIKRRLQTERLTNVQPVLGTSTDPRLPADRLDAALIIESYGEMDDPIALLKSVERSLKPSGCLGVVDFTSGASGPGPDPEERIDPKAVIKSAAAAGLILSKHEPLLPFQFLLVFGKTSSACR